MSFLVSMTPQIKLTGYLGTKERILLIIDDMPQLVVDLKNQDNYIIIQDMAIPFHTRIGLSADLLAGKRENVLHTAVNFFYSQACEVAEGVKIAKEYRRRMNTTARVVK